MESETSEEADVAQNETADAGESMEEFEDLDVEIE